MKQNFDSRLTIRLDARAWAFVQEQADRRDITAPAFLRLLVLEAQSRPEPIEHRTLDLLDLLG